MEEECSQFHIYEIWWTKVYYFSVFAAFYKQDNLGFLALKLINQDRVNKFKISSGCVPSNSQP